ncbi:MAG: hypothetical protein WKG01_30935 [Kofleriaceae bacterium]
MMRTALRALALCFVIACGGTKDDNHADEFDATLVIEPATAEVLIENNMPASQTYTAKLVWPDGFAKDVTAETYFHIDAIFDAFTANTATVRTAGKLQVIGSRTDKSGNAQLIARLKATRVDPSVPPNTPDLFNGPEDASRAPNILYPPADVVMPRNLGDFETHWIDPHGNDVFEVSLKTEFADVRVYVAGGNGLASAGPMASWSAFLAQEWLEAVGIETTVSYQVRGVQLSNPTVVGAGPPRQVKLSNELMQGGLYYWAAESTVGPAGIFRHDMSKPGQPAEEFMTTNQTGGRCVACHVLSRDGTRMAITYDGGNGASTLVDVATATRAPESQAWNFATFTPDASKILTVHKGTLVVRDSTTQGVIVAMPSAGRVSHPDLSADGTRLVYVRSPGDEDWRFPDGRIYTRSFDPVTNAFGAETPLVTEGVNNFYPSWSPDGQYVLFNRSDTNGVNGAYNNGNASLWVIKADGAAPAVELVAANQGLGLTNAWGRWAPFSQTIGTAGEQIYWVTVSSKRAFGTRLATGTPQIWMTPFRVATAAAGQDPSVSAFRLPFQNLTSSNHIAQWTERVVNPQ